MMLIPLHRRWHAGTVDTGRPCAYAAFDEADPPERRDARSIRAGDIEVPGV